MKRILLGVAGLIGLSAAMPIGGDNIVAEATRPTPKRPRISWLDSGSTPANKRAAARLEAHRAIWDNTPSADKMTRQRTRRMVMGRV